MLRTGWVTAEEICYLLGIDKSKHLEVREFLDNLDIETWKPMFSDSMRKRGEQRQVYYSLTDVENCIKLMM